MNRYAKTIASPSRGADRQHSPVVPLSGKD
jgi:hypothetical protein